jgi:hypothetical protein
MSKTYELPDAILLQAELDDANAIINKLQAENKKLRGALEVAFEDFKKQGYHKQANKIFKVLKE